MISKYIDATDSGQVKKNMIVISLFIIRIHTSTGYSFIRNHLHSAQQR